MVDLKLLLIPAIAVNGPIPPTSIDSPLVPVIHLPVGISSRHPTFILGLYVTCDVFSNTLVILFICFS